MYAEILADRNIHYTPSRLYTVSETPLLNLGIEGVCIFE
jgi:hypothetical protein